MPPVKEDKKYCVRYECPYPGVVTVETFHKGFRQQALITASCDDYKAYIRILEDNGYEAILLEDTVSFARQ